MTAAELVARAQQCRASTQTDSLTVVLDLSETSPEAVQGLEHALQLPSELDGSPIPEQAPEEFPHRCRAAWLALSERDLGAAIEFATVVSAFIHECRHVHDLRSTRMGAELLLHDLQVYAGVGVLLDRLGEWQASHPDRRIPLPLAGELEIFEGAFDDIAVAVRRSVAARDRVWRWWNTRSQRPYLPGHSLLDLFEFVGIWVQVEWLARVLRPDIAEVVSAAIFMDERRVTKYFRPGIIMAQLNASAEAGYEPDQQDPSRLFWSALNANGVDETVDDGRATDRHAGTWFGLFVQRLMDGNRPRNVPAGLESAWAAEDVLERHGVPGPGERYDAADRSLEELQSSTLRALVGEYGPRVSEPLLVALDVAIDYRATNSLILGRPEYHLPQTYVELLLSGELPAVHVRVLRRDGLQGDFRTPSSIPSSHVGGARMASEASQQMRLLLEGRGASMQPYSASVLATLQAQPPAGRGLRFRLGKPPPRRRLGPPA